MPKVFGWLFAACLLILPWLSACGHGSEFIFARIKPSPDGPGWELEASIEFLDNPLVEDREEARLALTEVFRWEAVTLGVPWWEESAELKDEAAPVPMPSATEDGGTEHRWLTARWSLSSEGKERQLQVDRKTKQAVVLWEVTVDPEEARWQILLAGDHSFSLRELEEESDKNAETSAAKRAIEDRSEAIGSRLIVLGGAAGVLLLAVSSLALLKRRSWDGVRSLAGRELEQPVKLADRRMGGQAEQIKKQDNVSTSSAKRISGASRAL